MTRKDYIIIAQALTDASVSLIIKHGDDGQRIHDSYCLRMAEHLGANNPAFKRDLFLKSAGHSKYI